jgi:hypothetical protein
MYKGVIIFKSISQEFEEQFYTSNLFETVDKARELLEQDSRSLLKICIEINGAFHVVYIHDQYPVR